MNDLIALIRIQLYSALDSTDFGEAGGDKPRKDKKKGMGSMAGPMMTLLALALLAFQMYNTASRLVVNTGDPSAAIYSGGTMATLMVFTLGISKVPTYLFGFKDYDMLISMPIPRSVILASKISSIYAANTLYSAIIMAPMFVVYAQHTAVDAAFWLAAVVGVLLIGCVPFVLCAVISFALAKLASVSRHKNLVMLVGNVLFMVIYIVAIGWVSLGEMSSGASAMGTYDAINRVNVFVPMLARAAAGSLGDLALFAAVEILPMALFIVIFASAFASINATMNASVRGQAVRSTDMRARRPAASLFAKDMKTILSSHTYFLNMCTGLLMLVICAVVLLIVGNPLGNTLEGEIMINCMGSMMILLLLALSNPCSCAISVEGSQFYLLKSMPTSMLDVIKSKLKVQLVLSMPCVVFLGAVALIRGIGTWVNVLALTFFGLAGCIFLACLGLVLNIRHLRLDFKSMINAVKAKSYIMAMTIGSIVSVGAMILYLALSMTPLVTVPHGGSIIIAAMGLILLVSGLGMWNWLRTKGVRTLEEA